MRYGSCSTNTGEFGEMAPHPPTARPSTPEERDPSRAPRQGRALAIALGSLALSVVKSL
jgi:hypothetical protein